MKFIKYSLVVAVSIFTVAGSLPGCSSRVSTPLSEERTLNDSEKAGEKIFMENCQRCHPQGEAGLGPAIHWAPDFAKRFQVRHGAGVMPAFDESQISKEEMDQLMDYLKAIKESS